MKQPKIGDLVLCKNFRTEHIVESIEVIDNNVYVFTEDVKCFPLENLLPSEFEKQKQVFLKFLDGEKLTDDEFQTFDSKLDEMNLTPFDWKPLDVDEYIRRHNLF